MNHSEDQSDRLSMWQDKWKENNIGFHQPEVHKMLEKHLRLLIPEGNGQRIFFPLCGKAVDMKWLADQGHTVVGVDGVKKALVGFYNEQQLKWTEKEALAMGPGCQLLESCEGNIKLYCGDMMSFSGSVEGQFDAIWDRGSLVALDRADVQNYIQVLKNILKPGGRILVEVIEYDLAIFEGSAPVPPPFAIFEAEMKSLYGKGGVSNTKKGKYYPLFYYNLVSTMAIVSITVVLVRH